MIWTRIKSSIEDPAKFRYCLTISFWFVFFFQLMRNIVSSVVCSLYLQYILNCNNDFLSRHLILATQRSHLCYLCNKTLHKWSLFCYTRRYFRVWILHDFLKTLIKCWFVQVTAGYPFRRNHLKFRNFYSFSWNYMDATRIFLRK